MPERKKEQPHGGFKMRPEEIGEIRERCEKAAPGPWLREGLFVYVLHHNGDYKDGKPFLVNRFSASIQAHTSQGGTIEEAEANTDLIAHARTDIPKLLAEIDRLKGALEKSGREADRKVGKR